MRYTHIRNADLNLLVSFQALIEERSISRAALRVFRTPSAMSRVVDRLQDMFKEQLFTRTGNGFQPTSRALRAYAELEQVLPRIETLLQGPQFNPAEITDVFRIEASDSTTAMFLPGLAKVVARDAPGIQIEVVPRSGGFGGLETNDVDLVIGHNVEQHLWIGKGVQLLRSESLCREKLVCFLRVSHPLTKGRVTLKRYLEAKHLAIWPAGDARRVAIPLRGECQRLVASALEPLGKRRDVRVRTPYGTVVARIVENTDLVATILSRIAKRLRTSKTRIIPAPAELRVAHTYKQFWHPRNDFSAVHTWLRGAMRTVAAQMDLPP